MLLAVAFAVLPIVAAEPYFVSPPAMPHGVFPAPGTVLPANGHLLVEQVERVLVTHDDGRVEDLPVGDPFAVIASQSFGTVTPDLSDGETITLERVCDGCATSEPLSWVVGPNDDTAPVFVDVGARAERIGEGWAVSVTGRVAPAEEALLHVVGDDGLDAHYAWQVESGLWSLSSVIGTERELCLNVVAIDAAGNESEAQSTCVDLVDPANPLHLFGCASTGTANTALFALTALLLRRRRR
jgi:hypothetical protein